MCSQAAYPSRTCTVRFSSMTIKQRRAVLFSRLFIEEFANSTFVIWFVFRHLIKFGMCLLSNALLLSCINVLSISDLVLV